MAESRQRYQDAVARALALRIPGLDAVPPFLSRIVPLGCAMHHCKLVGQECHVYSIESADGPVIFTFSYEIQRAAQGRQLSPLTGNVMVLWLSGHSSP